MSLAPPNVAAAIDHIAKMRDKIARLAADYPGHYLAIADVSDWRTAPHEAEEPGYIDWPNADFKACEVAWATAIQYLGLSGLTWKFPLRRRVSEALQYTDALLTEARAQGAASSSGVAIKVGVALAIALAVLS